MKDKSGTTVTIRLTDEQHEAITKVANKLTIPVSTWMRMIVLDKVKWAEPKEDNDK